MNAELLYNQLKQQQVELWCQGKMLRFRAPDGVLDEATMAELRKHKKELIELIKREEGQNADQPEETSQLEATTLGQQAMYFLHLAAPYSPAYNVASAFRIHSPVNDSAVRSALQALVSRHDALRSTFDLRGGKLLRRIHRESEIDFAVIEVQPAEIENVDEMVKREYQRPFDLVNGPLIRARLFKLDPQNYIFLMTLHHIIFDAWSLWVVQEEFHKLYLQFHEGTDAELLPVGGSFSDFVHKQESLVQSPHGKTLLDYWKGTLAGELPTLNLPLDFPRPQRPGLRGGSHRFRIPSETTQRLRQLAKDLRVTPFVLTLSIFKVLLHRICNQNDVIVGTTTSGRLQSDFTRTVGYFVNTLALRSTVDGNTSFAEYAGQVKQTVLGAIRNQDYPFAALVDRLGSKRESGRAPVCSVMFGLQKPRFDEAARLFNEENDELEVGGWKLKPFDLDQQEGQFDLVLELFETEDSFVGLFKYDSELFQGGTVARLGDQYLQLAESILNHPSAAIDSFELLTEGAQQELLDFSRGESLDLQAGGTVIQLFERTVKQHRVKPAVICGDAELSFAELDARSNQLARLLQASGVSGGDIVVCCCERTIEVPVLILGIMKAGAAYLPLDITSPATRLTQLIQDSGCRLVIGDDSLPELTRQEIQVPVVSLGQLDKELREFDQVEATSAIDPLGTAYVLYTSGSTGIPKGVCVPHEAFYHHVVSITKVFELSESDRVLQFSNLTFDPSLEQFFSAWSVGATVVMRGQELWAPDALCEAIGDYELTVINLPPAYFKHCAATIGSRQHRHSLRLVILGGDVFPAEAARSMSGAPVRILNAYGPTEAVITSTTFDASAVGDCVKSIPIGRPKPGSRAYVLDDQLRLQPVGVPGQLFLAGPMLASSYLNDQRLTDQRFVSDAFAPIFGDAASAKMYRTGDIARWKSDGNLEFLGRADRQIKIYGIRVETGEIESVLNQHAAVRVAYVDSRKIGEQTELVAWIVPESKDFAGVELDLSGLQRYLQGELPKFMVPRHFLILSELPLNSSGKIDTTRLPEPDAGVRRTNVGQYVPPGTAWEKALANIWSEELNVSPVGLNDNFFDLGGASLSSLRIVSRMNEERLNPAEQPLKPELLFEFQTIAELATKLLPIEQSMATG